MESVRSPKQSFGKEWPILFLLLCPFIVFVVVLPSFPFRIPTHFNLHGSVDRYGNPLELLILPCINIAVSVLLYFIPRLDPKQANIILSLPAFRWIRFSVAALLAYIFFIALANTFNPKLDILPFIAIGLLAFFCALGLALPQLKQNYMIGVRLPWTLESKENWELTHTFAGKLWTSGSIIGIVLALIFPSGSIFIAFGVILILVVWTGVYSYRRFRNNATA